jgi:hypothetical protein
MNELITSDMELPSGYSEATTSLAVSLARAEVDQQIATARALPRQLSTVVQRIETLATLDDESAEECVYALPRGGKPIKGPSIRLAEIIGSQWGNARVGARVVHVDRVEKFVEAEGVFHDLETNMATTARVRRRIVDSKGKLYTDDMIIVTGNAACSIAKRNAILGAVPKAVWRKAYAAVEKVIAGDVKTLVERREQALKAFAAFGVKPEQVFISLGVNGLEDVTLEHLSVLTGMRSALKSGEATVEEMFARKQEITGEASGLKDRLVGATGQRAGFSAEHVDRETDEVTKREPEKAKASPEPQETRSAPEAERAPPSDNRTTGEAGSNDPSPSLRLGADGSILEDVDGLLAAAMKRVSKGLSALVRWHGALTPDQVALVDPIWGELKRQAALNKPEGDAQPTEAAQAAAPDLNDPDRVDWESLGAEAASEGRSKTRALPKDISAEAQEAWVRGWEAENAKIIGREEQGNV